MSDPVRLPILDEANKPKSRRDCETGGVNAVRPCQWIRCFYHLARENGENGSETCSLDVADRGGATLEEVGEVMKLTRERIRQIEQRALRKLLRLSMSRPDLFGTELSPKEIMKRLLGGDRVLDELPPKPEFDEGDE